MTEISACFQNGPTESIQKVNREKKFKTCHILVISIIASMGMLYSGYQFVVFNPMQESISKRFQWTDENKTIYISLISAILSVGMIVGSFVTGAISSALGRKLCFILYDCLGLVGLGICIIPSTPSLIIGRFLCGMIVGGFLALVPLKIFEDVPREYNNMCGAISGLSLAIGVTVALSLSTLNQPGEEIEEYWWEVMFAFPSLFLIVNLIFYIFIFTSDTPKFLFTNKNDSFGAQAALRRVYCNETDIQDVLANYQLCKDNIGKEINITYKEIFFSKKYRRLLLTGIVISLSGDWTGMSIINSYSTMIFLKSSDLKSSLFFVSILGYTELLTKFLSIFLFSINLKKRIPFLVGLLCLFGALFTSSFLFYSNNGYYVRFIFIFIIFIYGLLVCPVIVSTIAELLPDKGVGILICIQSCSCILSVQIFPFLIETILKLEWTMMIYAGLILALVIAFAIMYNETTGMSRKEIFDIYQNI